MEESTSIIDAAAAGARLVGRFQSDTILFLPLVGEVKITHHHRDAARNSGPRESLGKGASESIGTSVVPVGVGAKGSGDRAQQFKLHVGVDQK